MCISSDKYTHVSAGQLSRSGSLVPEDAQPSQANTSSEDVYSNRLCIFSYFTS